MEKLSSKVAHNRPKTSPNLISISWKLLTAWLKYNDFEYKRIAFKNLKTLCILSLQYVNFKKSFRYSIQISRFCYYIFHSIIIVPYVEVMNQTSYLSELDFSNSPVWNIEFDELDFFPSLKPTEYFFQFKLDFFSSFWARVKYFDGPCLTIYSLSTIYRDIHYQFLVWWIHYSHCYEFKR